jgi:hypothetical protein
MPISSHKFGAIIRTFLLLTLCCAVQSHAKDFTYEGLTYTTLTDNTCQTKAGDAGWDYDPAGFVPGNNIVGGIYLPYYVYDEDNNGYYVTKIGEAGFCGCTEMDYIVLPHTITEIGESAFLGCTNMYYINIPYGVTKIEETTFALCYALYYAELPETLTTIGKSAFAWCTSLPYVHIPASVDLIIDTAFTKCTSLQWFSVDENNPKYAADENGTLYYKDMKTLLICPGGKTELTIPEGVSKIWAYACYGTGLTSITFPSSVSDIVSESFAECTELKEIKFADSDETLSIYVDTFTHVKPTKVYYGRYMAFTRLPCTTLETAEFGEKLTHIDGGAFKDAKSLRTVIAYNPEPPSIDDNTFREETYLNGALYVPITAVDAYKAAPGWKKFAAITHIGGTVSGASDSVIESSGPTVSAENGAILVRGASDVRIVTMNGTTIYSGHGETRVDVAPGLYIVITDSTATKLAVK